MLSASRAKQRIAVTSSCLFQSESSSRLGGLVRAGTVCTLTKKIVPCVAQPCQGDSLQEREYFNFWFVLAWTA
eukprot:1137684-Amphidinium_carterae.1